MKSFCVFAFIPLLSFLASASEAEFLPLNKLVFISEEVAEAGKVTVEINARKGEFTSLSIEAFGRKETLKPEDVKLLAGFRMHSLIFTHEVGYDELGGYTVGLRFTRYFHEAGGKQKEETASVSISKSAPIRVDKYPKQ